MRFSRFISVVSGVALVACAGCASVSRTNIAAATGGNAALFGQFRAYDGRTGRPIDFATVVQRCADADVLFFGEEHNDPVCNQVQAQLLYQLARKPRPVALSMEFFEADTQADLDAYLRNRIAENDFRTRARQGRGYVHSHRPLIELARDAHIPVVAANAPRRLVSQYRKSGLEYDEFRAGLDAEDQRWLPRSNAYLTGPYEERFFAIMTRHGGGGAPASPPTTQPASPTETQPAAAPQTPQEGAAESSADAAPAMPTEDADVPADATSDAPPEPAQDARAMPPPTAMPPASEDAATTQPADAPATPSAEDDADEMDMVRRFFMSQLLWDDSMAESIADYRARHASRRVMHIVGVFHVEHEGGTVAKFRARCPNDRVLTIVYHSTLDGAFPFDEDDRGAGDIVIYGIKPPPEPPREAMPLIPAETPPAETQPAAPPPTDTQPADQAAAEPQPAAEPDEDAPAVEPEPVAEPAETPAEPEEPPAAEPDEPATPPERPADPPPQTAEASAR